MVIYIQPTLIPSLRGNSPGSRTCDSFFDRIGKSARIPGLTLCPKTPISQAHRQPSTMPKKRGGTLRSKGSTERAEQKNHHGRGGLRSPPPTPKQGGKRARSESEPDSEDEGPTGRQLKRQRKSDPPPSTSKFSKKAPPSPPSTGKRVFRRRTTPDPHNGIHMPSASLSLAYFHRD